MTFPSFGTKTAKRLSSICFCVTALSSVRQDESKDKVKIPHNGAKSNFFLIFYDFMFLIG
ncbi:hypothetical protein ATE49_07995 [Elizabethkingia miricola]|nr:hypothetical protein ATE49_07995 [Elizabethkingia miricola]